jgi:transposase
MKTCFKCGTAIELEKVSRRDECPKCGTDLRVCLNCAFYAASKSNACEEPQAEPVKEKDRANYCDFFRFKEGATSKGGAVQKSPKAEAEKLWNDLFKKR